jgi:hypothetical protein
MHTSGWEWLSARQWACSHCIHLRKEWKRQRKQRQREREKEREAGKGGKRDTRKIEKKNIRMFGYTKNIYMCVCVYGLPDVFMTTPAPLGRYEIVGGPMPQLLSGGVPGCWHTCTRKE